MTEPFIPKATADKLNQEHPKGTRHKAKMDIAISLIGNGIPPAAVAATLREKFPEASDHEIEGVVKWASDQNPTPSGFGNKPQGTKPVYAPAKRSSEAKKPSNPVEHVKWWLNGQSASESILARSSRIPVPEQMVEQFCLAVSTLYAPEEFVNVVCRFASDKDGKARPLGGGKTLSSENWQVYARSKGVPGSEAGGWQRMNPVKEVGTGADGSYTDADVTSHRFVLLESDVLPLEFQLRFFTRIKLPVAIIMLSGGKSAHAWVRVNAKDEATYKQFVERIITALKPFGFDISNKNPSRLSRLVGAKRENGASGDGFQKLLWLPESQPKEELAEETLAAFELQLTIPDIVEQPMLPIIRTAMERYDELARNVGKLGIPTGIAEFDRRTGGLKGGQMTVVAAGTNGGKSTFALNVANSALHHNHGVALITMEMDRDEIVDLLFSMNGRINRNVFNTGEFTQGDIQKFTVAGQKIASMPLWIFDDARLTMEELGTRIRAIRSRIGLVIVDYIQIVSPDDPREQREQQVAGIARELRILAKETKLPFVVLSQLNDDGKLRESRVVAHEAHNVIMLECNEGMTEMEIKVVKGRQIRKESYLMEYAPEYCLLLNKSHDVPEKYR